MLWPLYLDRTIVVQKRIRASLTDVSEITSHGEAYIRLQPFVVKVEQDNSNPLLYRVLEQVPAPFGLWKMGNSFQAVFSPSIEDQDGKGVNFSGQFDLSFIAPKFESRVRARETEEAEIVEVIEVIKIQVLSLIAPYVVGLIDRAHRILMDRLAEQVEGEDQG